ncbi:MAG TPA: cysteine desulfurase family protein, partial [Deltaproteobacteria bacterium]|nr:cysteine desulfurase family protein [Deltaproteobacteria bacterium]
DHRIHLDHASSSPVTPRVLGVMMPYFANHFSSPSSAFFAGEKPRAALAQARESTAGLIGADAREIVFTASGTEANNIAVLGAARARGKGHIVVSPLEHASVMSAAMHLKHEGFSVTVLEACPGGLVDPAALEDAMRDDTVLVSVLHASHETGVIQDIRGLSAIARARGAVFHCDCVQSAGRIPIDVNDLNADLISLSSPVLGGPRGAGALYIRKGTRLEPVFFGRAEENGIRPGHMDIPAITGFGLACKDALERMGDNAATVASLRDLLEAEITSSLGKAVVNGAEHARVCHISSISFEGVPCDAIAAWLDLEGITVSPRASVFSHHTNQVLEALGLTADAAFGTVRFSPGIENTEAEMVRTSTIVEQAATRIRESSEIVGDDAVCILAFSSRAAAARSIRELERASIPCVVTARPIELDALPGPRIALAVPCPSVQDALHVLEGTRIHPTA